MLVTMVITIACWRGGGWIAQNLSGIWPWTGMLTLILFGARVIRGINRMVEGDVRTAGTDPLPARNVDGSRSYVRMWVVAKITDCALDVLRTGDEGTPLETALAGLAATAGAMALRSVAGEQLLDLEPGATLISEAASAAGTHVLDEIVDYGRDAGLEWPPELIEVPEASLPQMSYLELVRRLEPPIVTILSSYAVPEAEWALHVGLATVALAHRAGDAADTDIVAATIAGAVAAGCSVVPYP